MTSSPNGAEGRSMRLGTLLPRAVLVVLVWMLATAAFTFAADQKIVGPSRTASSATAQPPNLVVPSVTGQVFVFAKGILEDAGFAWRVTGPVHGYPGNRVLAQSPAAGTHVVDTGAPTLVLHLVKGAYAQNGAAEDTPSYTGTRIELPHAAIVKPKAAVLAPKPKPKTTPKPAATPKATKPTKKQTALRRPPDFTVPGGRNEPQN